MQLNLSTIDYAIIIGYFVIVIFINFSIKKNESGSKLENYFLAGRKLTLPLFVASLVSTWYGNLLGVSEIAFKHGLVNWLTQGLCWYLVYFFFAFFLVEKIHKSHVFSIPDQLERSYDKPTAVLGAFINIFMLSPAIYILSTGLICQMIFGVDRLTGILMGTLVPLFYTVRGGFRAAVYTDLVQFLFMFIGIIVLIPFAYCKFGGVDFLVNNLPASHLSLHGEWPWQLILAWFLIALWTLVDPGFYQRTLAAKDSSTAKRGLLFSIFFWFVFDVLVNLIGLYAFAAMPNIDPSLSLPIFATSVLPIVFKGIFFTGLIATVMSTLDSLSFSSAMAISYDIYRRLKPSATEDEVIKVHKIALVVSVLLAMAVAMYFESLMNIMYTRGTIAISALLVPLLACYWGKQKPSSGAAFWSMVAGLVAAVLGYIFKQSLMLDIEPIFLGLALSLLVFVLQSKVKQ